MAKYTVNMADQLLKVREKVQEKLKKEAEVVVEIEQPSALQSATADYLSRKEEPHPLGSPKNLNEMKKVEIKLNRGNVDKDIQKIVKHIGLVNKKRRPNQQIKITQNMSDDSVTLDGGKNVDIDREVADIRNFIGYKSAKVVESVEEETLDEGKFKVGDTVIPSVGPHKGRKHEVIADLKNNTYNIKPIGLLAKQIQYRLGAAKAKANQIKLVKEETLDEGKMKELAMKIAQVYSNMKKDKNMRSFADKFRKDVAKSLDIRKSLEKVLPDYVAGKDITNIMSKHVPGHKEEGLDEKVSYVEYKFKNARDAGAAKKYFDAQQRMSFDVNDDNMRGGELMVDAGKNDMTQFHKEVMKKFRPKVMSTEAKLIDKPTGEVLKTGSKKEMETEKKRNRDELQVKEQSNGTKGE